MTAIEDVLSSELKWSSPRERHQISRMFAEKGFPGCVGLIDGTLIELLQRPRFDGETYYDRKANYSINAQIVCDHRRKITFLYCGLPGSVQDVSAARRSTLWKYLERDESVIFGREEYLLGDSGYIPMPHLVPAFKVSAANCEKSDFNNCLAHARVINEHCIGVLKSRWHSLKQLRTQLKSDGAVEHDPTPNENPTATGLGAGQSGTSLCNRVMENALRICRQHGGFLNRQRRMQDNNGVFHAP
ncbi:hypothetical protein R1sor_015093 [Riccia sorocarpa]